MGRDLKMFKCTLKKHHVQFNVSEMLMTCLRFKSFESAFDVFFGEENKCVLNACMVLKSMWNFFFDLSLKS